MNEQITMFSDPLEERALTTLRRVIERSDGLKGAFDGYYGGMREGYCFCFDPRTKCFYYASNNFNSWRPEPWVRKKTITEIRNIFGLGVDDGAIRDDPLSSED